MKELFKLWFMTEEERLKDRIDSPCTDEKVKEKAQIKLDYLREIAEKTGILRG